MNSMERVMKRMQGEEVDYLPNLSLVMSFAAKQIGVPFGEYVSDYRLLGKGALLCYEKFGFDMVCVISDPMREAEGFGAQVIIPEDDVPYSRIHRLRDISDINTLKLADPASVPRMNDRIEAVRFLKERVGNDVPVVGWVEGAVAESCDLMQMSEVLMNFLDEPEAMEELLSICEQQAELFAREQIKAGADIIGVGDAASSLIGPALYEEFALPFQQKLIKSIHEAGARVKLHICGNSDPVSVLLQGNVKEVEKEVQRCMAISGSNPKMAASIYLTLEGLPFLYYGEEIAMIGTNPHEEIRTPLLWGEGSGVQTSWYESAYNRNTVDIQKQQENPDSLWNHYQRVIKLRSAYEALYRGKFCRLAGTEQIIAYERRTGAQSAVVLHNISSSQAEYTADFKDYQVVFVTNGNKADAESGTLLLEPLNTAVLIKNE